MNGWNVVRTMKRRRRISPDVVPLYRGGKSALNSNRSGEGSGTLVRGGLVSITSLALNHEEGELRRAVKRNKKVPEAPSRLPLSLNHFVCGRNTSVSARIALLDLRLLQGRVSSQQS